MRKNRGTTQDQGLKYILSLLLIIGSFLYAVYLFFENKAIDINSYYCLKNLISILISLIFLHVIYLFFEGISIKIQYNEKLKKNLNIFSKFIYLISFSFFLILILFILFFYSTYEIDIGDNILSPALFLFFFSIAFVILKFFAEEFSNDIKEFSNDIEEFSENISLMNKRLYFLIAFIPLSCCCILISLKHNLFYILFPIIILILYICYCIDKKRSISEDFSEIISLNKPSIFLIVFILLLYYCILKLLVPNLVNFLVLTTILILWICYCIYKKRLISETFLIDLKKLLYLMLIISVICIFIMAPINLFIFSYSISSHIMEVHFNNNMESVYSKKDIQIPITIQVTGGYDNLSVYLVKENSTHNFIDIDNITLEPKHNLNNTKATSKEVLVGNSLGYGTYNIFINTSTITPGYYELIYTISKKEKYDVKGFYLLDDNFSS